MENMELGALIWLDVWIATGFTYGLSLGGYHLEPEPLASECNWMGPYKEERKAEQESGNKRSKWHCAASLNGKKHVAANDVISHISAQSWQVSLVTCHPFYSFHFMLHSLISFSILKYSRVVSYTAFRMPPQIQLQLYFVIWYVSGIETIKKIDFDRNLNCHPQSLTEAGIRKGVSHSRLLTPQNALKCASKWWIPCWLQIKQYTVLAE